MKTGAPHWTGPQHRAIGAKSATKQFDWTPYGQREPSEKSGGFRYARLMANVECARCGYTWDIQSPRNREHFCTSCKAGKVQTVTGVFGPCVPWHGRFAPDHATPIDDYGKVVRPGTRLCGNADCVSARHIERDKDDKG
jgi:hypothetical protein